MVPAGLSYEYKHGMYDESGVYQPTWGSWVLKVEDGQSNSSQTIVQIIDDAKEDESSFKQDERYGSKRSIEMIEADDLLKKAESENGAEPSGILTKGYVANGVLTLSVSAVQALVNRFLKNNEFSAHSEGGSWSTMMDMSFAHFSNKMVKGNWTAVDSEKKQALVLIGYIAAAALFDTGAWLLPVAGDQPLPIGQATIIAGVNAAGYYSAMASAAILQKVTYTVNKTVDPNRERTSLNMRRFLSGLLLSAVAMGAAASNRTLVSSGSPFGLVLNVANNEVVNKIFKTGQGTEDTTSKKIALLGFYGFMGVVADVAMGFAIPSSLPLSSPTRYFGGTSMGSVISFLKVSAKALLDHGRGPVDKSRILDHEELEEKQRSARNKAIFGAVTTVAVPVLAIIAEHTKYVIDKPWLALGIKLVQHNLTALAAQEVNNAVSGTLKRSIVALAPFALALTGELIANRLDPANASLAVASVAIATGASYLSTALSAAMVGGDGDGSD